MKLLTLYGIAALFFLGGCVSKPPVTGTLSIESSALPSRSGVARANPFCLHVKFTDNYYYYYSENYAEAFVHDGPCPGGARRAVETLGLIWRYKGEGFSSKECVGTDSCSFSERNYGIGKVLDCASAAAQDGDQAARVTTNSTACPR